MGQKAALGRAVEFDFASFAVVFRVLNKTFAVVETTTVPTYGMFSQLRLGV